AADARAARRLEAELLPRRLADRRGQDDRGTRRSPARRRAQRPRAERLRLRGPASGVRDGDAEGSRPVERNAVRLVALAGLAALTVALAGCGSASSSSVSAT